MARPEEYGFYLNRDDTPFPKEFLNTFTMQTIKNNQGNLLLSSLYADGCPAHPAFLLDGNLASLTVSGTPPDTPSSRPPA